MESSVHRDFYNSLIYKTQFATYQIPELDTDNIQVNFFLLKSFLHVYTVPLAVSYHQFWFLIGYCSVAGILCFIKKRNEKIKYKFFDEKQQINSKRSVCKLKVAFFTLHSSHWPVMK